MLMLSVVLLTYNIQRGTICSVMLSVVMLRVDWYHKIDIKIWQSQTL
jgi:hypothetical protein